MGEKVGRAMPRFQAAREDFEGGTQLLTTIWGTQNRALTSQTLTHHRLCTAKCGRWCARLAYTDLARADG